MNPNLKSRKQTLRNTAAKSPVKRIATKATPLHSYNGTDNNLLIRPRILLLRDVRTAPLLALPLPTPTPTARTIITNNPILPRLLVARLIKPRLIAHSLQIIAIAVSHRERLGESVRRVGAAFFGLIRVEAGADFFLLRLVWVGFDEVLLLDAVPAGAAFFAGSHALDRLGFVVFDDEVDELAGVGFRGV